MYLFNKINTFFTSIKAAKTEPPNILFTKLVIASNVSIVNKTLCQLILGANI